MKLVLIRWLGALLLPSLLLGYLVATHVAASQAPHRAGVVEIQSRIKSVRGLDAALIAREAQPARASATEHATTRTRTFWLQTMDSCQEARPGATYVPTGNGVHQVSAPGNGAELLTVGRVGGDCPLQHGNCLDVPAGCVSWQIPIPSSGNLTYVIYQLSGPPHFTPCVVGNTCEYVVLTITDDGTITARTHCVDPKGRLRLWPLTGDPYSGSQTDPAVFHNFYYR